MRLIIVRPNSSGLSGSGKGTALIAQFEGAVQTDPTFLRVLDDLRRLGFNVVAINESNASLVATEQSVVMSLSSLMNRIYEDSQTIYWGE